LHVWRGISVSVIGSHFRFRRDSQMLLLIIALHGVIGCPASRGI